jgi:hypothetical protein
MRAAVLLWMALLAGCEAARIYFNETAGITPGELLPIAMQERQYVDDRDLEAKVRAVVAPSVGVDVYLKEVTLRGASGEDVEAVRRIPEVKKVESR